MIPKTLSFTTVALLAGTAIYQHALAKTNLCVTCPVPGVNSHATTALGSAHTAGPCSQRPGSNGFPIPDPACTPGAFNPTVGAAQFGSIKFKTACLRDCITDGAMKKVMYKNYGAKLNPSCELDHLVPLEMGGADSLDNIWPQCGVSPAGKNYKDLKDVVEQYLSVKVLLGMNLLEARKGIASDWTKYLADAQKFCASQSCDIQKYRK